MSGLFGNNNSTIFYLNKGSSGGLFGNNNSSSGSGGGLFGGDKKDNSSGSGGGLFSGGSSSGGGLFSGGDNKSGGFFSGSSGYGNFREGDAYESHLKQVLNSFIQSFMTQGVNNMFKMPIYVLHQNQMDAHKANQNNRNLINTPNFEQIWSYCHNYNPNPDEYSTFILLGLNAVKSRQEEAIKRSKFFVKLLEESKKHIASLENNLNGKIRRLKERNNKILNKILKLEKIIYINSLSTNYFDRKSNQENQIDQTLNQTELGLAELEDKIVNLQYVIEDNPTGDSSTYRNNENMLDIYAVEEPRKSNNNRRNKSEGEQDIHSEFFETLSKMKTAMEKAEERLAKTGDDLNRLVKFTKDLA